MQSRCEILELYRFVAILPHTLEVTWALHDENNVSQIANIHQLVNTDRRSRELFVCLPEEGLPNLPGEGTNLPGEGTSSIFKLYLAMDAVEILISKKQRCMHFVHGVMSSFGICALKYERDCF